MTEISIIIPVYNLGKYLPDAVESVLTLTHLDYEICIVNDGSTDAETLEILKHYENHPLISIIHKENRGLAHARNTGIEAAKGKNILLLDADNYIDPQYVYKSLEILKKQMAHIVYALPVFIGEDIPARKFRTQAFDIERLLEGNYIDACAVFEKTVWQKSQGFDPDMPIKGCEDWDFWIQAYLNGFKFYFLNEPLYYYRIRTGSMITETFIKDNYNLIKKYIYQKHFNLYEIRLQQLKLLQERIAFEETHPLRTSLKYLLKFLRLKS